MVLLSIRILEIFFFISYCYKQSSNFINRFPSKNCFYLFVLYFDLTMFQLCTVEILFKLILKEENILKNYKILHQCRDWEGHWIFQSWEVAGYLPPFSRADVTCLKVVTSSSSDSLMERSRAFCPSSPRCNLSVLRAVCISDILRAVLDPECLPDCLGEGLAPTSSNTQSN